MIKKSCLVSIIIPTRNKKEFLYSAVKSALNQSYENIQVIVHDNNSIDDSEEYILSRIKDKRLEYYRVDHDLTMTDNWNKAFSHVKGEYFVRLDDDNVMFFDLVEKCLLNIEDKNLDVMGYSPLIIDLNKDIYSFFEEEKKIYILNKYNFSYLEYHCLTDSNYFLYRTGLLRGLFNEKAVYFTTLPDRFINYTIASRMKALNVRVGISTEIKGITRFDYRPRQKADFIFKYVNYSKMYFNDEITKARDCQSNFSMHRINTLSKFFENNVDQELKLFFEKNILSSRLYVTLIKTGHINELNNIYSIRELFLFNIYMISILIDLLRHPMLTINEAAGLRYFFTLIRRSLKFNARGFENIVLKKKRVTDNVDITFGNNIVNSILERKKLPEKIYYAKRSLLFFMVEKIKKLSCNNVSE
ncbi:MAG: glycosyltransferase family 2 protein [bacterium]|nr:glycosyltransferase family 2 protein [bacterium]